MKNKELSLTDGVPLLKILVFCTPLFALSILTMIQSPIIQSLYTGSKIGTLAFSIPAMFTAFWQVFNSSTSGINIYAGVKVAAYRASGDEKLEKMYFANSFYLTIFIKVFISSLALILHKPIFKLLSVPTDMYDIVFLYFVLSIVANVINNVHGVIAEIYYGLGSIKTIFILRCLSPIMNIIFGVLFFKICDLGMVGVTTYIIPGLLFCLSFYFISLFSRKSKIRYRIRDFKINFELIKELFIGSTFYTIRQFLITICAFICQIKVNQSLDQASLTAMTILLPFSSIYINFGVGFRLFTTKNHTIKNYEFLKKGVNQTLIFLSTLAAFCMIFYFFLGDSYMNGIGLTGAEKELTITQWRYYAVFNFPALIVLCSIRFMFEGAGYKNLALLAGVFEAVGYLLITFILIPLFGKVVAMNYAGIGYSISALYCLVAYFIKRKEIYGKKEKNVS